jgi:type I restriction enzyme M protein
MADERAVELPRNCDWPSLADRSGTALIEYYTDLLRKLGAQPGIFGHIYAKSQNRFNNPVNLKRLINLIAETERTSLRRCRPSRSTADSGFGEPSRAEVGRYR